MMQCFSRLRPLCWVALSLSLAMHIALIFSVGKSQGGKAVARAEQALRVSLITKRLDASPETNQQLVADQKMLLDGKHGGVMASGLPEYLPNTQTALLPIFSLAEPYYFHSKELSEKPRPEQEVSNQIAFPEGAQLPDTLVLNLLINETGVVDKVEIEGAQFPQEVENAIVEHFSKIKFYPGEIERVPVKSRMRIEVQLDIPTLIHLPNLQGEQSVQLLMQNSKPNSLIKPISGNSLRRMPVEPE